MPKSELNQLSHEIRRDERIFVAVCAFAEKKLLTIPDAEKRSRIQKAILEQLAKPIENQNGQ